MSIFIHYDAKDYPVCSVGMFYTILFTWKFSKNILQLSGKSAQFPTKSALKSVLKKPFEAEQIQVSDGKG